MSRKKELLPALLLCALCLGTLLLALGGVGSAGAALPSGAPSAQPRTLTNADTAPLIKDPYHHLSGIFAISPEKMLGRDSAQPPRDLGGPLTPPIFGPNVDASLNNPSNQNETTITIDPDNDLHVLASANDYRANLQPWVYRSTDGGTTWVNYQVPGTSGLFYGDPAMAYDHGNYAYFSYLGYQGSICSPAGGMYVSRSTDAGATFSAPIQLAQNSVGSIAILQDKEYVAVDTNPASPYAGNTYVAWTQYVFQAGPNCGTPNSQLAAPIVLSRSTDHGISWTVPITASPPVSNNNSAALPVVGRQGQVYLYYVGAATQSQINYDSVLFSRSTDGGQTFPFFTRISDVVDLPSPLPPTNFRNNPFGAMAADQQLDGYLYAVWADYRTGDADILLSRSTDDGTTWGTPVRVNDDPVSNGKDQFFPWIASAPDGRIHIGWFDRREDALNRAYKEYYTSSTDHGATWEANIAVSSAASNPGTSNFIGDYSGLAASNGVVMPIWTDIRSGSNQNAYTARGVYVSGGTPTIGPSSTATVLPTNTSTATATPAPTNTAISPPSNTPTAISATATSPAPTATSTAQATATACTITFTDVPQGHTFYPFVRCLACRGIINGYPDGTFKPDNLVTRGQLAKIVSQSAGFTEPVSGQTFEDVVPGSTFYEYVERLASRQVMGGYQCGVDPSEPCGPGNRPYFRPNAGATRGQLTKIVSNAASFNDTIPDTQYQFTDVEPGSTFWLYVERLLLNRPGVMSGYPCGGPGEPCDSENRPYFRPNNPLTRGQTSKIVANTFFPDCQTPGR